MHVVSIDKIVYTTNAIEPRVETLQWTFNKNSKSSFHGIISDVFFFT